VFADRFVVLRNLISLWEVRVKVILPGPLGFPVDGAVEPQTRLDCHGHRDTIQHRQGAWQTKTHRTRVHVRGFTETGGTRAKQFGVREELTVTLEANDSFVLRVHANSHCSIE
jgi:hypothetical protein